MAAYQASNWTMQPSANETITGIGITKVEQWIQLVVFYCLLSGVVSMAGNIAMAVGIIRNKDLRTRFFIILLFILVSRSLHSLQYLILFFFRTSRTLLNLSANMKRVYCYLLHFQFYYVLTEDMVFLLALAVERTLAIVTPNYYRKLTDRQAITVSAAVSVATVILKIVPSLFGVDFNQVIPCINGGSPLSIAYYDFFANIDLVLAVIILLFYIGLVRYIHHRHLPMLREKSKRTGDLSDLVIFKRQYKLIPLLQRLIIAHCGLTLGSRIIMSLSSFAPKEQAARIVAYSGMIATVELVANVVIMLASNKDLRKATFTCHKTTTKTTVIVQPVGRKSKPTCRQQ